MGKGRPQHAKNIDRIADVEPSRCPACGSTNRGPYVGTCLVQDYEGHTADGRPYNRIVRRRCHCADCGQLRIDRSYEFDPAAA